MVVVTAASSNHAGPLRYMLESLRRLRARVECYDLGLTAAEVRALPRWAEFLYHKFDYARYPAHLDVEVNAGEYAWKPVIVAEVIDRLRAAGESEDVLWSDAGSYFHELEPITARVRGSGGLWLRASSGTMRQWTHPAMFARLGAAPDDYADRRNADATLIGFATGSSPPPARQRLYDAVVAPWRACALDRDCIAPAGSSRRNHRQDQAVLSYLAHKAGYAFAADTGASLGVRCKCDRWFYRYIGFHVPAPVYARCCLY
ncbi:MAG TPA: DUF1647 domain-containing protein [Vicinamibacterales bacterium]|nr:DUF1647 domain-containing protein [Vicinamibacterales bacterium]